MRTEETQTFVHQVKIDTSGRIVLPAALRDRLGVDLGDSVLVIDDDGDIRIETAADALNEAQQYLAGVVPRNVSLVDELIAERRSEAAGE
ncbi:AbrB/MazE/SpoVT family DNA-binding domain-containing protein [Planctomycetota bacterium]